jgi:HrpA-like RNA helicase
LFCGIATNALFVWPFTDVKYVIDCGRERQHSMMDSTTTASKSTTVVGSQLATVNISKAAAKQRAGRAGRVSAGTCFRLYTEQEHNDDFLPHTVPEMQRMELSQLVLHALSFAHPGASHPLHLLLASPDPPKRSRLRQTLRGLKHQGLIEYENDDENADNIRLTPLGQAVSMLPTSPRIGRMLFMGLMLKAISPALKIAALLSVPQLFSSDIVHGEKDHCSDVISLLDEYEEYLNLDKFDRDAHLEHPLFQQAHRVQEQLEREMLKFVNKRLRRSKDGRVEDANPMQWNENADRVAALVGLVCSATPHIAHVVTNDSGFSTRDVVENARMHPSSVNFKGGNRTHWYVYNELRVTKRPYLHATTAVSPLDLALFADASDVKTTAPEEDNDSEMDASSDIESDSGWARKAVKFDDRRKAETGGDGDDDDWLFVVDQWVPVAVADASQRDAVLGLRRALTGDLLQLVARDPGAFLASPQYSELVLYALAALEHERVVTLQ